MGFLYRSKLKSGEIGCFRETATDDRRSLFTP